MDTPTQTPGPTGTGNVIWRPSHAYIMAAVCLIIGFAIGYFLRGSAPMAPAALAPVSSTQPTSPDAAAPAPTPKSPEEVADQKKVTLDDMKRMADKQTAPLLSELQKNPKDAALLNKTAMTYKTAHEFDKAAEYFKKSLEVDPKNIAVRADYASCLYYMGDVDGALAQLNKSLTYDPKHAGTLYNIGVIEWKGKGDTKAAVASWEKMLKLNPNMPPNAKAQVQHMIEMVQQSKAPSPVAANQ